ncbi:MAG: DUF2938 family protein [Gammaproteobacteria bacterium]|nr:DUF2938 family protein [Gammaproteobacteria bacterium]
MIKSLVILYISGLVGTIVMDLISPLASHFGIRTGVTISLVGRWFIDLLAGKLNHHDIRHSSAYTMEDAAGWIFHYLIGGGVVAQLFAPWLWFSSTMVLPDSILPYILFGLATSTLPWLLLMPSFGWGLFGIRAPEGCKPLIASPINHMAYGIGIWVGISLITRAW